MTHQLLNLTLQQIIELGERDPASIGQVRSLLPAAFFTSIAPRKAGPPPGCPPISEMTAVQVAIFDNWPSGRRTTGQPNRYGMALEIWTDPSPRVKTTSYAYKCRAALLDARALKGYLKDLSKPNRTYPLDPGYVAVLHEIADGLGSGEYIALLNARVADDEQGYDRGTCYHAHQIMMFRIRHHEVEMAQILNGDGEITLPPFVRLGCDGKPLGNRVVSQSRHDVTGTLSDWSTSTSSINDKPL